MHSATLILALAGAAAAETVNLMLSDFGDQPLVVQSIGGTADATTYVLGCAAGTLADECGIPFPIVMVSGPKTVAWSFPAFDVDGDGTYSPEMSIMCSLAGTTSADCTTLAPGNTAGWPASEHMPVTGTDLNFVQATIVTDTASIQYYGTGWDFKPTTYGAAAVQTGASKTDATGTGMVTSKATLPSQTGGAASTLVSKASSAASDGSSAAASATQTGLAAQVTGLGAFAAAAVAGVLAMVAL